MLSLRNSWQFWALLSGAFAALTAVFIKIGIKGINSDFATFVRTLFILPMLVIFLLLTDQFKNPGPISSRGLLFLGLSSLATVGSWLAYFRALNLGTVAQVAPVDKLSIVLVGVFGWLFLGESLSALNWLGLAFMVAGAVLVGL